jgi:hypothetical protein
MFYLVVKALLQSMQLISQLISQQLVTTQVTKLQGVTYLAIIKSRKEGWKHF